eukprot:3115233-Rhodomonas_salina.5
MHGTAVGERSEDRVSVGRKMAGAWRDQKAFEGRAVQWHGGASGGLPVWGAERACRERAAVADAFPRADLSAGTRRSLSGLLVARGDVSVNVLGVAMTT